MKNFILLATLLYLSFSSDLSLAKLRAWSLYSSENFSIYTDARKKAAVELLKEFETFREAVILITGLQKAPENQRLVIMMYARNNEYKQVRPDTNVIGFYVPSEAGPRMIIGPSRGSQNSATLFHEYVHYLLREHTDINYPKWYDEGFAEVLGATTIKGTKVTIGAIPEDRLYGIRMFGKLSLDDMLNPDPDRDSDMYIGRFYGTAWLLTHYLLVSPYQTKIDLHTRTSRYMQLYNEGSNPTEAFRQSFEMEPREMDRELARYQDQRRFTVVNFDLEPYSGNIESRELSANERAFVLADLAWRVGEESVALEYLAELDSSKADAARGLSLNAILQNHKDDIEAASASREKALSLNGEDTQVLSNIAHHDWDSYIRTKKENSRNPALLQQTLRYTRLAVERDPENREAYQFQWQALRELKQPIEAVRSMMAIYNLEPGSIAINGELGSYLLQLNEPKLARPFIQRVYNWSHSEEQQLRAKELLDKIDAQLNAITASSEPSE